MATIEGQASTAQLDFNCSAGAAFDVMVRVLERCDEPTRDNALSVCRSMSRACIEARRRWCDRLAKRTDRWTTEAVPTMMELADNGCPRPDSANIIRTLFPRKRAPSSDSTLHWFHHRRGLLDEADRYGVSTALSYTGSTLSGGVNATISEGAAGAAARPQGFMRQMKPTRDGLAIGLYEGQFKMGVTHGLVYICTLDSSGSVFQSYCYEGFVEGGSCEGSGLRFCNGRREEGSFVADKLCGVGSIVTSQGYYRGQVAEGKRHGLGEEIDSAGRKVLGRWVNDVRALEEGA